MTWNNPVKLTMVVIVVFAVLFILFLKHTESEIQDEDSPLVANTVLSEHPKPGENNIPMLLDLGSDKCIPCKKMAPMLDNLREEYKGQFDVVFINVLENSEASSHYKVILIPTQIFFDETGTELFRHVGYFSREDILNTWVEQGYTFTSDREQVTAQEESDDQPVIPASSHVVSLEESTTPVVAIGNLNADVKVVAYYLHMTTRCLTCLDIEEQSKNTVLDLYEDELTSGQLEWHAHNMELPEYQYLQSEFDLITPGFILAQVQGNEILQWKDLELVWDLVEEPDRFREYVNSELRKFMTTTFNTG